MEEYPDARSRNVSDGDAVVRVGVVCAGDEFARQRQIVGMRKELLERGPRFGKAERVG